MVARRHSLATILQDLSSAVRGTAKILPRSMGKRRDKFEVEARSIDRRRKQAHQARFAQRRPRSGGVLFFWWFVACTCESGTLDCMAERLNYFNPHALAVGARAQGCLTCEYFRGQWPGGHVVCERFEKDRVIWDARIGCAYWTRAIGADD